MFHSAQVQHLQLANSCIILLSNHISLHGFTWLAGQMIEIFERVSFILISHV